MRDETARAILEYGSGTLDNLGAFVQRVVHGRIGVSETNSAWLPRAISSLPDVGRAKVNEQYVALIKIIADAGITPVTPVELRNTNVNGIEANKTNHLSLCQARYVVPLTLGVSTGRGWDMGFAFGSGKVLIPFIAQDEEVNRPTVLLPTQIPVRYNDLTNLSEAKRWTEFFKEMQKYRFGFGKCDDHGVTLIGIRKADMHEKKYCMRCVCKDEMGDLDEIIGKW